MEARYHRNILHDAIKVDAIYTIHYFKYGKTFTFPLEKHDFWELVYVDSGELLVTADNKTFTMRQGEACFHKPNVVHTVATQNSFANSVIISFDAAGRSTTFLEDKIFIFGDTEKKILEKIVREGRAAYSGRLDDARQTKMEKKENAPFGAEQLIKNYIELLLILTVRNNYEKGTTKTADCVPSSVHAERIVEKVKEILTAKINSSVNLDEIASALYFSKTYIKAVFKKYTGTTIIKYYNELKIDEAKRLISLNRYTVSEITKQLGFSSIHYFSRLFKQVTDMTPSEYSRSIKADNVLK